MGLKILHPGHRSHSVMRFMARLRHRDPEQFDRLEFAPGEPAQLDGREGALIIGARHQREEGGH